MADAGRVLRLFACQCAANAMRLLPRKDRDPRSLAAIRVARAFANGEATPEELAAARAAAWDAAWDAAGAAARDAAWDAAWAAAGAAAWAAAGAAQEKALTKALLSLAPKAALGKGGK
jgi:hypothetical protein